MTPQKLAFAVVLSNELLANSNAETVIRARMGEDLRLGVDTIMLDDVVGSAVRPPGLRYNVAAETASTDVTIEGMVDDLALISSKVAGIAGLSDTIIIASPKQAVKIWARLPTFKLPVFASSTLVDGVVMAVACSGVAVAGSPDAPRIDMNVESVVVLDDSDPAQLGTVGTPTIVGSPARSLFQSDTSCLRLLCDMTWQPRAESGMVSWVENAVW